MTQDKKIQQMIRGFLSRALNRLTDARRHLDGWNHAESVSASQESIELSMKSVFLLLQNEYPKTHEFTEAQFEKLLGKIPQELEHYKFPQLFLFHCFWSSFYKVSKYGYEKFGVPARDLFEKEEASLAVKHAEKCHSAASSLEGMYIAGKILTKSRQGIKT